MNAEAVQMLQSNSVEKTLEKMLNHHLDFARDNRHNTAVLRIHIAVLNREYFGVEVSD